MSLRAVQKKTLEPSQGVNMDNSNDDLPSESEMSEASDEVEEDPESSDEESAEDSGDEENLSGKDMDSFSEDDNAEGEEWMDVDDQNSDLSSSDDDESRQSIHGSFMESENGDPKLHGNAGWADAMAKILRASKPKGKKSIVLAKAKKLSQITSIQEVQESKEDYGFEIDGQEGDEGEEDVKPNIEKMEVKPSLSKVKCKIKKRDHLAEGKVKPSVLHRERERALSKIATKGVVQLFNAVRDQQKEITSKLKDAHGSIRKEEKIMKSIDKRVFLDVLMGNARSEKVEDHIRIKKQEDAKIEKEDKTEKPATWNVLRDNFLTGSNLKDWDKHGEIKLEGDIDEVELN